MPANHGGVGRYVYGILRGFDPDQLDLWLAVQRRDADRFARIAPWATIITVPPAFSSRPLRLVWEQVGLPFVAWRSNVDVIHSPHYTFPIAWRRRRVVTLHDATFFSDPEVHRLLKRRFFRSWIRRAWRLADAVVTPSSATAGEVERFLGAPAAIVEVALLGVNAHRFHPPTSAQLHDFRTEWKIGADATWFAFLGTIEPRKNLVALLDAYAGLRDELGPDCPKLLISGGRGWDTAALARLDALPEDSGVIELGYLPVESLPALLGGAVAVMYPSLGEGFGLPVLEAMACGAAVITSNRLALPEVGGNAVVYTDVDASSIAAAMREIHRDVPERVRVRALAIGRAALFTWTATATAHVRAYRDAATSR